MSASTARSLRSVRLAVFVMLVCLPATGCGLLLEAAAGCFDDDDRDRHCKRRHVVVEMRRCR